MGMNGQFVTKSRVAFRPLTLLLILFLLGLQFALWVGDKNVYRLRSLEETVENTRKENIDMEQANQRLIAEVLDLKQGGETLETLARYNLGLIKKGEVFYQIIE